MSPAFRSLAYFPHRCKPDGTIDSICPRCYATIGTSTWEADLERMETAHLCDPVRLIEFEKWRNRSRRSSQPEPTAEHLSLGAA